MAPALELRSPSAQVRHSLYILTCRHLLAFVIIPASLGVMGIPPGNMFFFGNKVLGYWLRESTVPLKMESTCSVFPALTSPGSDRSCSCRNHQAHMHSGHRSGKCPVHVFPG